MIRSASARTGRRISRSSIWRALRAIPNLQVFRPADAVETAECWELALPRTHAPVGAGADAPRRAAAAARRRREPLGASGAYVLAEADGARADHAARHRLGSRARAWRRAQLLAARGIAAAVVSMPCWELFEAPDDGLSPRGARQRAARRDRGRRRRSAGSAMSATRGSVHRHARLRRLGAGRRRSIRHFGFTARSGRLQRRSRCLKRRRRPLMAS